jgi:hypothetical protein
MSIAMTPNEMSATRRVEESIRAIREDSTRRLAVENNAPKQVQSRRRENVIKAYQRKMGRI